MIDKLAQAARAERNEVSHSPQLSGVALEGGDGRACWAMHGVKQYAAAASCPSTHGLMRLLSL